MTSHSSKPNKLKNVNPVRGRTGNVTIQNMENLLYENQSHRAYHKSSRKTGLSTGEVLNKIKSRRFRAASLSTYDFSTLYTTLPHNLIKEKLINLIG